MNCQVSGVRLVEGDPVVVLLLEPFDGDYGYSKLFEPKSTGNEYRLKVNSPLIQARMGAFGFEAVDSNALSYVKQLYKTDFSADDNLSRASKGLILRHGGSVETKKGGTLIWTVHKDVYDALPFNIGSGHLDSVMGVLKKDLVADADESLLQELVAFITTLKALGIEIDCPFHDKRNYGPVGRGVYVSIQSLSSTNPLDRTIRFYRCALTGRAMSPGDKLFAIPIESRSSSSAVDYLSRGSYGAYGLKHASTLCAITRSGSVRPVDKQTGSLQSESDYCFVSVQAYHELNKAYKDHMRVFYSSFRDVLGVLNAIDWSGCFDDILGDLERSIDGDVDVDYILSEFKESAEFFSSRQEADLTGSELRGLATRTVLDSLYHFDASSNPIRNKFLESLERAGSGSLVGKYLSGAFSEFSKRLIGSKTKEEFSELIEKCDRFADRVIDDLSLVSEMKWHAIPLRPGLRSKVSASPKLQVEAMERIERVVQGAILKRNESLELGF